MTINIKQFLLLGLLASFALGACEQFEEFNQNPNEPTEVSPDVLFASGVRTSMNTLVTQSFLLGNNVAQLSTKTLRTEVDTYNWNAFPTLWEGLYESLTDIYQVETIAAEAGNGQLEGAAIVWKVLIFSTLTNAYGDIPYSEAIGGAENNFTPAYDDQEAIYNDMLAELQRASNLLGGDGSISGDLIYNNDASKWQKLANSLRLRLLMTASNALSDADAQFASIVASENIMESNEDNATLTYQAGLPNQFPLLPLKIGDFDAVALSQNAYEAMSATNDPRLSRYARPDNEDFENPEFSGAVNGANSSECSKAGSNLGLQYYDNPNQPLASDLGLPTAQGIAMTYAEVEFLLAEAAMKGWINDDPETYYRQGIAASMEYHQVNLDPFGWTDFEDFYNNSGVAYDDPLDIWEQKWLALFFHGMEPLYEVRRWYSESGGNWNEIPFLSAPCQNLNSDELPSRFLYPGEEQSLNSANYQVAIDAMGGNDINASTWLVE